MPKETVDAFTKITQSLYDITIQAIGKDAIMELLTEQLRQHDEETIRDYKATLLRKCTDDKAFRALGIVLEAASKA
jgi:hypothetical protein